MPKTFVSGTALPAADLNTNMVQPGTAGTGTRVVAGTVSTSFSAQSEKDVTITFGFTFSSAPTVTATVHVGSFLKVAVNWNNAPTTTGASAHLFQVTGTNITNTVIVHWIAVGPA